MSLENSVKAGLRWGSGEECSRVALALEQAGTAVRQHCEVLLTGSYQDRLAAVSFLTQSPDPSIVPILIYALRHDFTSIRKRASAALIRIGGPAVPAVAAQIRDKRTDAGVLRICLETLAGIGAPAVPALCELIRPWESQLSRGAAEILGEIAERQPSPELKAALPVFRRALRLFISPYETETQRSYRTALRKIGDALACVSDLPVPASPPRTGAGLPRPVMSGRSQADGLPRPAERTSWQGEDAGNRDG